jgi:5-hydroxyisourate hydrolase
MTSVSTHVLDTAGGGARSGVAVRLTDAAGAVVGDGTTDADGRIAPLAADLAPGAYTLTFDAPGGPGFLQSVAVTVALDEDRHYHVPLLASAWSAVTYLGT